MARQIIDTGTLALNGQDGDTNREAAEKCNANFQELYAADSDFVRGAGVVVGGSIAVFAGTTGTQLASRPVSDFEPAQAVGTAAQYRNGLKALADFATSVRASALAGLSVATASAVVATDTVLTGIGKLQAQLNAIGSSVLSTALSGLSLASSTAITATDTVLTAFGKLQAQVTARALKGANSDITALSGLTTALSVAQGGTGGNSQGSAQSGLGLVPVTSLTDVTAGRLLIPGWMGLGATMGIPLPGGNANQILPSGIYWTNTSWTGSPYPGTDPRNRGQIFVQPWGDATYQTQSFSPLFSAANNPKLERAALAGVWRAWDPVIGGLSALSDPANETGGLMFYGSNANGEFWKFANGLLICKLIRNVDFAITNAATGVYFGQSAAWTFPLAFVGSAPLVNSSHTSSGVITWEAGSSPGLSSVTPAVIAMQSIASRTFLQILIATGRWK